MATVEQLSEELVQCRKQIVEQEDKYADLWERHLKCQAYLKNAEFQVKKLEGILFTIKDQIPKEKWKNTWE